MTFATKLTKGGQTTVPKEVRVALGITDESRVYWQLSDGRAIVTAEPPVPNEVCTSEEFWDGIARALDEAGAGQTRAASELSADLRARYGLA